MSRISIGGDAARGTPADTYPVFVQTIAASLNLRRSAISPSPARGIPLSSQAQPLRTSCCVRARWHCCWAAA